MAVAHPRDGLLADFQAILGEGLANTPEQLFVNVPVGKLVDKALERVAQVPAVPRFDPEVTPVREFSGALTRDDVDAGATFDTIRVAPATEDYTVEFHAFDGRTRQPAVVRLPVGDAEQFLLSALATVYHQREQEVAGT